MIELKQINGNVIDLSISNKFIEHYNKPNSFAKQIIDKEINNGLWYDELLAKLPDDAIIIDAGANVGLFSLYLMNSKRSFMCIEPTGTHLDVMIDLFYELKKLPVIIPACLSNKDGQVLFSNNNENTTMNKISNDGFIVMSYTLKTLFSNWEINSVDLLKLDVEGAEQQIILEDATIDEPLKKCKLVFIEIHPEPWEHADEQGIIQKMKSLGFTHKQGQRNWSHYFINND